MKTNKPQHVKLQHLQAHSDNAKKRREKKRKWLMQVAKSHVQGI